MWKRICLALFVIIAIAISIGSGYIGYTHTLFHPIVSVSLFLGFLWGLIIQETPSSLSYLILIAITGLLLGYLAGLKVNSLLLENYYAFKTISLFIILPAIGSYICAFLTKSFEIN